MLKTMKQLTTYKCTGKIYENTDMENQNVGDLFAGTCCIEVW